MVKKTVRLLFLSILFVSCSEDNDVTVPRNLKEYLAVNSNLSLDEAIACAASANNNATTSFVFYYPIEGASDVRYYETDSTNVDENDLSLYKRKSLVNEAVFGGYLEKFIRTGAEESWGLVTYITDGKLHKSNPIRLKNKTKPTEWKDTVRMEYPQTLRPKFSWDDGVVAENTIYFQVITDANNDFLSGTYTTDKWFEFYNLDNVVLNITTQTPPALIIDKEYHFTLMGVSEDNWVNLVIEKMFIAE